MFNDFREVLEAEIPNDLLLQITASVIDNDTGDFYIRYHRQWWVKVKASKWVISDKPTTGSIEIYKRDGTVLRGKVKEGTHV